MMQQTSLAAYRSIQKDLNKKQKQVFEAIKGCQGGVTDQKLSEILGWSINRITPRRLELETKGVIQYSGLAQNPSGRAARVYAPV